MPSSVSASAETAYEVRDPLHGSIPFSARERDIINQGGQMDAAPGSGATVCLGMTIPEVERALGRPINTVDLGAKKILVYKDLKVTFLDGRVSDVQ